MQKFPEFLGIFIPYESLSFQVKNVFSWAVWEHNDILLVLNVSYHLKWSVFPPCTFHTNLLGWLVPLEGLIHTVSYEGGYLSTVIHGVNSDTKGDEPVSWHV
jgi:hypothetical protein